MMGSVLIISLNVYHSTSVNSLLSYCILSCTLPRSRYQRLTSVWPGVKPTVCVTVTKKGRSLLRRNVAAIWNSSAASRTTAARGDSLSWTCPPEGSHNCALIWSTNRILRFHHKELCFQLHLRCRLLLFGQYGLPRCLLLYAKCSCLFGRAEYLYLQQGLSARKDSNVCNRLRNLRNLQAT
jgi:hypothetical protein